MAILRVQTTQNVALEYEIASVGDRIVAALIDYSLYAAWVVLIAVLTDNIHLGWLTSYVMALPTFFYVPACEIFFNGQTLGKRARHLRVMRLDGTPARVGDYLLRWLLRPVEIVLFLGALAAVVILLNGRGQRLGDLLAGTTVLNLRRRPGGLLTQEAALPSGYQPVFREAAQLSDHDAALLRQLLSRALAQQNFLLLHETALKVKSLLGLQSDLGDEVFLRTILRDHAHQTSLGAT